ncbi:hypothetical protein HYW36_00410 [Candidatus Saccharibacteria bacterium]|nr:hypothetical protein [Candidatus Saccharibacteria bacterium]
MDRKPVPENQSPATKINVSSDDFSPRPLEDLFPQADKSPAAGKTTSQTADESLIPAPTQKPTPPSRRHIWLWPLFVLVIGAGVYAALDSGLINNNLNLPVHIFGKSSSADTSSATQPSVSQTVAPAGFSATKIAETKTKLAYPTQWGTPTATTDLGFTKRSQTAKPDVNYAILINFPSNKDVQLAITSAKYLPPARNVQYYDYLQWCVGSVDAKYYAGVLRYSTTDGVDMPGTVSCDQGPLNNATRLSNDTIVQTNIKSSDDSLLGDIYTKNLQDQTYPVARVKDGTMKNRDLITTMLTTIESYTE